MRLQCKPWALGIREAASRRFKASATAVRTKPYILGVPFALFSVLLVVGIWSIVWSAAGDAASARSLSQNQLAGVALSLELSFSQAVMPVRQLAELVQRYPDYNAILAMWDAWVPSWWSWAPQNASRGLYLVPQGVTTAVYPRTPRNLVNMGLDALIFPLRDDALVTIDRKRMKVTGMLDQGSGWLVAVNYPVFIGNLSADTNWSIPHQATDCPAQLCSYNSSTRTKWWGFVLLLLDVNSLLTDRSGGFLPDTLRRAGQQYRLSTPTFGSRPEDNAYSSVYASTSNAMPSNALCTRIQVVEEQWQLCVWKASWQPAYLVPLLVVLVLVALALSATTFAVLLSRHEHKALLRSLLPKAAIAKMQADCQWAAAASYQSQLCMVGSGTPAEMILGILEDILQGRPPALHNVMAVRHALQQSLDVYKPLQADLSQRMAHTPNMDGEVKDALMLQLVGRMAAAETVEGEGEEAKEGSMGCEAKDSCGPPCDVTASASLAHSVILIPEDPAPPAGSTNAPGDRMMPPASSGTGNAAQASGPTCLADAAPSKQPKAHAAATASLADQGEALAAACPTQSASRDQARDLLQPGLAAKHGGSEGQWRWKPRPRPSLSLSVISTKRPDQAVSNVLLHIMAQQQPERPPPCSGAALLADPAGAATGHELLSLPQQHPAWRPFCEATGQDTIPRTISDPPHHQHSTCLLPLIQTPLQDHPPCSTIDPHLCQGSCQLIDTAASPSFMMQLAVVNAAADDNATTSHCRALSSHPLPVNAGAGQGLAPLNPLLQVQPCLSSANSWAFDAFQLTSATAGRPLSVLAYWLLHQTGLTAWASMDLTKLSRWLCRIEDGYCANPYHNRSHAADVVQTMHMLLTKGGLMPGYADHLTQLAAYLAAVCHDYQHIGRTNDWLVETQDELALRYNDRSPMENHHLAGAFSLLKHPDLNFLQAMPKASYDRLRKLMIELVLGTDMKQHFGIIGQFTALHRTGAGDGSTAGMPGVPSNAKQGRSFEMSPSSSLDGRKKGEGVPPSCNKNNNSPSLEHCLQPVSDQDKLVSMQAALKCADLGHLAAPLPVHLAWVSRLEAEFFAQGDAERAQGLPISPLCDRTKQGITKSQVGFFEFVALPLFNNFTARFTAAKPLLQGVMANYHYWQAQAAAVAAEGLAATTVGSDGQRTCGSRQQP